MKRSALLLVILSITLFAGCRTIAVIPIGMHATATHTQNVHPPHAPAHGYRHQHHDYDLEYDTNFDAYTVLGYDDIYFYNDFYLRFYAGSWQITSRIGNDWSHAKDRHIPRKLRGHKRYKRHNRHSPPPHAPAHGHSHSHNDGVDLIFDSGIGAYIALGFNDLFFFDNRYMRFYDGYWHHADRYDGRWRRANDKHVPRKLWKARKHNNKGLFKEVKHKYKKQHREHRENREYRKKHGDRWNRKDNGKADKRRKDHRDDDDDHKKNRDGDRNRDRHDGRWLR